MKYTNCAEEELKNKVREDFFHNFDCTKILKKIDFAVRKTSGKQEHLLGEYFLWAEAKAASTNIYAMLTQLVLTIGKARTFDEITPPPFLGCFDCEKIAFIPYHEIQSIFYQSDFNWKVAPSNHKTREFALVYDKIKSILDTDSPAETYLFDFHKDAHELKHFIKTNFIIGKSETTKTRIDKNNFITIYNKWLETVKPSIAVNWNIAKQSGIIDGDFYLADLLSADNKTLKEKLFVLLKIDKYELDRRIGALGLLDSTTANFSDGQKAHARFWAKYERPPLEEYWDYIVERRDLLVPQDMRERKGSFFTPQIWVELSQKYIADVLGEDWQDEYTIWDCAAGTGNMLAGLTNKYNIWASTLDKADVDVMKDRIHNGANLLENHVFQFDFLNDEFSKLPEGLQEIIQDENKRKKLLIYINPPYTETMSKTKTNKAGLHLTKINEIYISKMRKCANREIFIQFLIRIYYEIPGCVLANFSTLKNLQAPNFADFRQHFQAKLQKIFLIPANTFDNVKGKFPIAFMIWDTNIQKPFKGIIADVFDTTGTNIGTKAIHCHDNIKLINTWIIKTRKQHNEMQLGFMYIKGQDFQNAHTLLIINNKNQLSAPRGSWITDKNLIESSIYFAVRKVIPADWLNDCDQFLYPNDGWKTDEGFQNNCLAYTLFSNHNNIQVNGGVNHWIPFTEKEIDAPEKFKSRFMTDFIAGKITYDTNKENNGVIASIQPQKTQKALVFSAEAKAVFEAGKKLWRYYHAQHNCNVNASLYDIRAYFQGRDDTGRMKNTSDDAVYNEHLSELRTALKALAHKITPKVYEFEFLKGPSHAHY